MSSVFRSVFGGFSDWVGLPNKGTILWAILVSIGVVFTAALMNRIFPDTTFTQILNAIISMFIVLVTLASMLSLISAQTFLNVVVGPLYQFTFNNILSPFVNLFYIPIYAVVVFPLQAGSNFLFQGNIPSFNWPQPYHYVYEPIDFVPLIQFFANIFVNFVGVPSDTNPLVGNVLTGLITGSGGALKSNTT